MPDPQNDRDTMKKEVVKKLSGNLENVDKEMETTNATAKASIERGANAKFQHSSISEGISNMESIEQEKSSINAAKVDKDASIHIVKNAQASKSVLIEDETDIHHQEELISSTSEVQTTSSVMNYGYVSSSVTTFCSTSSAGITATTTGTQPHTMSTYPSPSMYGTFTAMLNAPVTDSNFATFLESEQTQSMPGLIAESYSLANGMTPSHYTTLEPVVLSRKGNQLQSSDSELNAKCFSVSNDNVGIESLQSETTQSDKCSQSSSPLHVKNVPNVLGSLPTDNSHQKNKNHKSEANKTRRKEIGHNQSNKSILPNLNIPVSEDKSHSLKYALILPRPSATLHVGREVNTVITSSPPSIVSTSTATTQVIIPATSLTMLNPESQLQSGKSEVSVSKKQKSPRNKKMKKKSESKNSKAQLIGSQKNIIESFIGKKKSHAWETLEQTYLEVPSDQEQSSPDLEFSGTKNIKSIKDVKKKDCKKKRMRSDKKNTTLESKERNNSVSTMDDTSHKTMSMVEDVECEEVFRCLEQTVENIPSVSKEENSEIATKYKAGHAGGISNKKSHKIANRRRLKSKPDDNETVLNESCAADSRKSFCRDLSVTLDNDIISSTPLNDGLNDELNDGPSNELNDGSNDELNDGPNDGLNNGPNDGPNDRPNVSRNLLSSLGQSSGKIQCIHGIEQLLRNVRF